MAAPLQGAGELQRVASPLPAPQLTTTCGLGPSKAKVPMHKGYSCDTLNLRDTLLSFGDYLSVGGGLAPIFHI